jgi:hypothetical protein
VILVGSMLTLNRRPTAAKSVAQEVSIQRQIDATDRQIDQPVYKLYGLTDDEIRVVEEGTRT